MFMSYTCEITGITAPRALMGCHVHHWIKQQAIKREPDWYAERGIKQRLIIVWHELHASIHSGISDKSFKNRWGVERNSLLFNKKAWRDGYYDRGG
jgi:hypothetical protein